MFFAPASMIDNPPLILYDSKYISSMARKKRDIHGEKMKSCDHLKVVLFMMLAALIMASPAHALTGAQIIEKSDQAVQGKTQIAEIEITVKTRRWTRTLSMKSFGIRGEKKSFSEIHSPKKDAGNRFLLIGDNMWHYVPNLQQTIKISPSMMLQSWMGSDFTNDDIVKESSIVNDYTHEIVGEETVDGHACYKLELIPKPEAIVVWGKIVYYARVSDCLPVREEFYNEHNVLKKQLFCEDFRHMDDRIIPIRYRMQTVSTPDRYTMMEIKSVDFDEPIDDFVFSLQNLKRR